MGRPTGSTAEPPAWSMRRRGDIDPTRVYAGCIPQGLLAGVVPSRYHQRWACQKALIWQMISGANLNANSDYTYRQVPSQTQKRQRRRPKGESR